MKHSLNILSLFFLLTFNQTIAQGEAALPFLSLTPSPQFNGLGWTGVSVPNNDAFGFHYNPAMLGYFGQKNNLSFQTYPGSTNWWGHNRNYYNSSAFNLGYNFKNQLKDLNLSVGVGYIHNRFSHGTFTRESGSYESYDSFDAYGIGVSIDFYLTFALGITFKNIHSELFQNPIYSFYKPANADATAIDYGFLITLPIIDLVVDKSKLSGRSKFIPELNYSLGYSRLNIGEVIYYVDPAQADPLPLTARLGHTINLGCNYESEDISINLIDYDLILEADDILINRRIYSAEVNELNNEISYQGMLGDIVFGKHLIQLKGDENVVVHKGNLINLLETVTILNGSFTGRGYSKGVKTYGLIISSSGLLKWLGFRSGNNALKFIANHIELKYINSTIFDGEAIETDFSGLSVSFINYSFN